MSRPCATIRCQVDITEYQSSPASYGRRKRTVSVRGVTGLPAAPIGSIDASAPGTVYAVDARSSGAEPVYNHGSNAMCVPVTGFHKSERYGSGDTGQFETARDPFAGATMVVLIYSLRRLVRHE